MRKTKIILGALCALWVSVAGVLRADDGDAYQNKQTLDQIMDGVENPNGSPRAVAVSGTINPRGSNSELKELVAKVRELDRVIPIARTDYEWAKDYRIDREANLFKGYVYTGVAGFSALIVALAKAWFMTGIFGGLAFLFLGIILVIRRDTKSAKAQEKESRSYLKSKIQEREDTLQRIEQIGNQN